MKKRLMLLGIVVASLVAIFTGCSHQRNSSTYTESDGEKCDLKPVEMVGSIVELSKKYSIVQARDGELITVYPSRMLLYDYAVGETVAIVGQWQFIEKEEPEGFAAVAAFTGYAVKIISVQKR